MTEESNVIPFPGKRKADPEPTEGKHPDIEWVRRLLRAVPRFEEKHDHHGVLCPVPGCPRNQRRQPRARRDVG